MQNIVTLDLFDRLFDETIDLIEQTVRYLETGGKTDRFGLPNPMHIVFATESMRLSTQLMQTMAWLMVQKAVRLGEISAQDAANPIHRLGARRACEEPSPDLIHLLPEKLNVLAQMGRKLYFRVGRLDQFLFGEEATPVPDHSQQTAPTDCDRLAEERVGAMVLDFRADTIGTLKAERARIRRVRA